MSTPRPAMLVAIVTAPGEPASAMISPSRSACSGLAFSTVWSVRFSLRPWDSSSPPSLEDPTGELVDDFCLAVDHRVIHVALVEGLRLQRLDQVVDEVSVLGPVEVIDAQEPLGLGYPLLGDGHRLVLLVKLVVEVR